MLSGKNAGEREKTEVKTAPRTYIQFTNILEVLVQRFDHVMDELEHAQLVDIVIDVDANDEVQRRVPTVDNFVLAMIQERALVLRS